jgi:hypothetical protein
MPIEPVDITPSVDRVALLLRTRTVGVETGLGGDTVVGDVATFTDTTRPTLEEVEEVIQVAYDVVRGLIHGTIFQNHAGTVKQMIAWYAAIIIETSFFDAPNTRLLDLWQELFDAALASVNQDIDGAGSSSQYGIGMIGVASGTGHPGAAWRDRRVRHPRLVRPCRRSPRSPPGPHLRRAHPAGSGRGHDGLHHGCPAPVEGQLMSAEQFADFGPLVIEPDVDAAVLETLRTWMPTMLRVIEEERDLAPGLLRRIGPSSYQTSVEDDDFPNPTLPAILATTAKTREAPVKDGNGMYTVPWVVVVSAIVRGRTPAETRWLAGAFGGCVRRVLTSYGDLGGFANQTDWVAGDIRRLDDPLKKERHLAAGINEFTVFVDNVVQEFAGPEWPDAPGEIYPPFDPSDPDAPYDPLVPVSDVITTIQIKGD